MRKLICSRCIAVLGFQLPGLRPYLKVGGRFHPLYRGTWFPTTESGTVIRLTRWGFPSAMSRYLVSNLRMCRASKLASRFHPLYRGTWFPTGIIASADEILKGVFPSAISRYLVSNPTRKIPPLTSGGGNGLHTPRRIDHIPTFASLNHDKNTRSNHYTPNAGIELSETTPPPLRVNLVQNCV